MSQFEKKFYMRPTEGSAYYRTPDPINYHKDLRPPDYPQTITRNAPPNIRDRRASPVIRGNIGSPMGMTKWPTPGIYGRPKSTVDCGLEELERRSAAGYCAPLENAYYNPHRYTEDGPPDGRISQYSLPMIARLDALQKIDRDCDANKSYQSAMLTQGDFPAVDMCLPKDVIMQFNPGEYINHNRYTDYYGLDGGMDSCCGSNKEKHYAEFPKHHPRFSYMPCNQPGNMNPMDQTMSRGTVRECLVWKTHEPSPDLRNKDMLRHFGPKLPKTDEYFLERIREIIASYKNSPYVGSPTKIDDGLYIGTFNDAIDHKKLKRLCITYMFNCAANDCFHVFPFPKWSGIVAYDGIPADDNSCHDMLQYVDHAVQFIDAARRKNGRVLVHCAHGVNRSAFICCAYMMIKRHKSLLKSVKIVKWARGQVLTNMGFQKQLITLARLRGCALA